jgi:hypothetical protein
MAFKEEVASFGLVVPDPDSEIVAARSEEGE